MKRITLLLFITMKLLNVEYLAAQLAEPAESAELALPAESEEPAELAESALPAETERLNTIGVSLGYSFTGYRDEVESLMNRYLNTFTYILDAGFERGDFNHLLNFNFLIGSPRRFAPYKGYNHKDSTSGRFCLSYSLDYNLWGNRTFPGYIGASCRTLVHYGLITDSNIYSPPAALILFSLDLQITQKWIINKKNSLDISLGYPLVGYILRPPYSGVDELWEKYLTEKSFFKMLSLGDITSFHNYWAFWGSLKYYYRINSLILLSSGLGFEISHIDFPKDSPRKDAIFQLNAGITFNF